MSVANLNYDESQKVYQIDLRMFIDDYLEVIGVAPEPGSPYVSLKLKPLKKDVKKYLDQHLFIYFNGELIPLKLSSFKLDDFTIQVTYVLESDLTPNQVEQIKVVDTIYLDEFSSQRNIIHVNFPGRSRKSLVFNTNQREDVLEW